VEREGEAVFGVGGLGGEERRDGWSEWKQFRDSLGLREEVE
jgi:hypothetical protein